MNVFENNVSHSGVKGMKWKDKKPPEELSPERQTFNEIMLGQYKGPMTKDEQAKYVAERFALEQQIATKKKFGGKDRYQMSNAELKDAIAGLGITKEKVKSLDKKKVARGKKRATKIISENSKKVVPNG